MILVPEDRKEPDFLLRSGKPGIKICPRCGSIDVDATTGTGYVSPPLYVCNQCNFTGPIFPEVEDVEALKGMERTQASNGSEEDQPEDGGGEVEEDQE